MSRRTQEVLATVGVAALQALATVVIFVIVELRYTGPGSIPAPLRWASAILWFPLGYLPVRFSWVEAAPMRIIALACLNGLIWGAAIEAVWVRTFRGASKGHRQPERA